MVLAVTIVAVFGAGAIGPMVRAGRFTGAVLILAGGVVLAATLTPQAGAFHGEVGTGTCDLARFRLADPDVNLQLGEALGNILLFVPLGVALALLPSSSVRGWLLAAAIALPIVIEGVQMLAPVLDRACQAADVADNLIGLAIGLLIGWVARRVLGERLAGGPRVPEKDQERTSSSSR